MLFHAQPIAFKPVRLKGLSRDLIGSHYVNNYGGAVRPQGQGSSVRTGATAACSRVARWRPPVDSNPRVE